MQKGGAGRDTWLVLIGVAKVVKGVLLLALGVGAIELLHNGLHEQVTRWINAFNVDPNSRFFKALISKLGSLHPGKVKLLTVGTFCYASLFLTEGIGLLLRKHWAEYFTLVVTGSFLPLEVIELVKKFSALKLGVIIANAAIVVYLVWRLWHDRRRAGKHLPTARKRA